MNKNIDLTKILENCPKGTKLYSTVHGEIEFNHIEIDSEYPIRVTAPSKPGLYYNILLTKYGTLLNDYPKGECILFPSKDQRDWSKFKAPWLKMLKFNPKTLQPFDKVLFKNDNNIWDCAIVSYIKNDIIYFLANSGYTYYCIPYNEETKHLIGTTKDAPEYYRYWEKN